PAASATALMAPALVALMVPSSIASSSSRRSSTPQVKAPCAPPPSSARLRYLVGLSKLNGSLPPIRIARTWASIRASSWPTRARQHNRYAVDHHRAPPEGGSGGEMVAG